MFQTLYTGSVFDILCVSEAFGAATDIQRGWACKGYQRVDGQHDTEIDQEGSKVFCIGSQVPGNQGLNKRALIGRLIKTVITEK